MDTSPETNIFNILSAYNRNPNDSLLEDLKSSLIDVTYINSNLLSYNIFNNLVIHNNYDKLLYTLVTHYLDPSISYQNKSYNYILFLCLEYDNYIFLDILLDDNRVMNRLSKDLFIKCLTACKTN